MNLTNYVIKQNNNNSIRITFVSIMKHKSDKRIDAITLYGNSSQVLLWSIATIILINL